MIGAAAGVQAEVREVAEIAVAPDRHVVFGAVGGFEGGGTVEAGKVEEGPLDFG